MAKADNPFKPDMIFLSALSKTIKKLRTAQGLTQEQLASLSKIHWRTIQKIEAGPKNITIGLLLCLANGLNMKPSKLIEIIETSSQLP